MPLTRRLDDFLAGFVRNCRQQAQVKAICQILGRA
jgi:hypothetical protein